MLKKITEGKPLFYAPVDKPISKDLPVFYNPIMEYNRNLSIALLNALEQKDIQIALPLAGTGIRGIRFLKELNKGIVKKVYFNDKNSAAVKTIKKNLKLNKITKKIEVHNDDGNIFLLKGKGFDYIDIDPFGSPNKFLNSAIERISRQGILAITATDTGALCGTFPKTCIRKYWATPLHNEEMHEIGLRILIRKIQLIGMQHEKALSPIISYSKDHYMRVFLLCKKSKQACDGIAKMHQLYKDHGPLWIGLLQNKKILQQLKLKDSFTNIIKKEYDILGFYDLPSIYKKEKINHGKNMAEIITKIKDKGFKASRTQFSSQGIKSNIPYSSLLKILED